MIQIDEHTEVRADEANRAGIDGGSGCEAIAFGFTHAECDLRPDVQDAREAGVPVVILRGWQSGYRGWIALAPKL